jgi:hypothetical protein
MVNGQPDFGNHENVIMSIEDASIEYVNGLLASVIDVQMWPSGPIEGMVLLRNPYHLFASRDAYGECVMGDTSEWAVRLWEEHASARRVVLYDRLLQSEGYAREIAEELGLPFRPLPKEIQIAPGGTVGSSFDGGSPLDRARLRPESSKNFTDRTRELCLKHFSELALEEK